MIKSCDRNEIVNPISRKEAELDTTKWHAYETLQEWIASGQLDGAQVCAWAKKARANQSDERQERDKARQGTSLAWEPQPPARIALSGDCACFVRDSGELVCWDNQYEYHAPWNLGPVRSISVSSRKVCAIKQDGFLACLEVQIGGDKCEFGVKNREGRVACRLTVIQALSYGRKIGPLLAIATGALHVCFLGTDFEVGCEVLHVESLGRWLGQFKSVPSEYRSARAIFMRRYDDSACVVLLDGEVACWSEYEVEVKHELRSPQAISLTGRICALKSDQTLKCLGPHGELHLPNVDGRVRAIAYGGAEIEREDSIHHSGAICVIQVNDAVACLSDQEVPLKGFSGPVQEVTVGDNQACAHLKNGTVACWILGSSASNSIAFNPPLGLNVNPLCITE
jgi:hypothetical protein